VIGPDGARDAFIHRREGGDKGQPLRALTHGGEPWAAARSGEVVPWPPVATRQLQALGPRTWVATRPALLVGPRVWGRGGWWGGCWVMLLSHPLDDLGWDGLEGHAGRADAEFMRRYATCRFG